MNTYSRILLLGGIVIIPAAASADTTLFGQAHPSVLFSDDGDNTDTFVSSNTSRIGIKGNLGLSDSLKAIYHLEWSAGLDGNDGDEDLKARNRFGGLQGNYGTLRIGRIDTPMKLVGRAVDLFWSTQWGQNRILTNNNGAGGLDARWDNVINYTSPKFSQGFAFQGAYSTDHSDSGNADPANPGENNDDDAYSVAAWYKTKPLYLGAAYESRSFATSDEEQTAVRVSGYYLLGTTRLTALYQDTSDVGGNLNKDQEVYGVGIAHTIGMNTFKSHYYLADNIADNVSLGWDRSLSKNTSIYATFTLVSDDENNDGIRVTAGGAGTGEIITAAADGEDVSGVSLGLRIVF